ncbi:MAG: radical SAM protein [Clostridia bacterium]|nr:radical SAM protein [Clostridia bacterium]
MISPCYVCPNKCGTLRNDGAFGLCGSTNQIKIAKYYLHPFEEPIISGKNGSGTVFFTGCALKCVFCQNYELSRTLRGKTVSVKELSDIFKELEDLGAHNINLVTPSHYAYQIIEALSIYKPKIPIVYNTHGYELISTLKDLNEYVDVYLPDLKFKNPIVSKRYTGKENYFEIASNAIKFMMENKSTVIENGLIKSGVIVRHLILPLSSNDSVEIVKWFKQNKKGGALFSLMAQYTPLGDISGFKELSRHITKTEYDRVLKELYTLNENECFIQSLSSAEKSYVPKWDF